jgi:hypothetical protein
LLFFLLMPSIGLNMDRPLVKPVFVNGILPDPQDKFLASCIRDIFLRAADDIPALFSRRS